MDSNHITPRDTSPPKPRPKPNFRKTGPLEYRVWDYDGGWMAEPYNRFAREPGKAVMMKYEGGAYVREFFIPHRSPRVFEVPRDKPLPTHARETIEAGRNAVRLGKSKKPSAKSRRTSPPFGNWR